MSIVRFLLISEKEDLVNLLLAHVNSEQYYDNSNSHQNHQSTSGTGNNGSNTSNLFKQFNLQNLWASVQEKYDNVRCRPSAGNKLRIYSITMNIF